MKKVTQVLIASVLMAATLAQGAALSAARNTPRRAGDSVVLGVYTGTVIYAGAMVAVNSSGYAVPAADTSGYQVIGAASATVDNSPYGASGAKSIEVLRGTFRWGNNAGITDADIGSFAYAEDDNSVDDDAPSQSIIAGVIVDVDSDGVWVDTYHVGRTAGSFTTLAASGNATFSAAVACTDADGAAVVTATGFEAYDGTLVLDADQGDDNADTWTIESEAADNDLTFVNHTTEIMKLTAAGELSLTAASFTANRQTVVSLATTSRVCTSADYGKLIVISTNAAVAITLPANGATAGSFIDFLVAGTDDCAPTISAAAADTLRGPNDVDLDSVTYGTGHRIGAYCRLISDGSFWTAINLSTCTMTFTD